MWLAGAHEDFDTLATFLMLCCIKKQAIEADSESAWIPGNTYALAMFAVETGR
jgi:hypothetical protein